MINTQYNILPTFSVLTRINVSRFAIVLFAALLALWQGVVFSYVPDGMIFTGPETITANVGEDPPVETTSNLLITSGTRTIYKTGGGTWRVTRALVTNNPTIKLQDGTIDFNGSDSNIQFSAYLVMSEGATFISNVNAHGLDKASTANNVMYDLQGAGNIVINSGKSFGVSLTDGQHTEFSGVVQGEGLIFAVYSASKTPGVNSLTLSGNNTFSGIYAVRFGTRLVLTDDAINSNASVYIDNNNSVVEYNVKNGTKRLNLTDGKKIIGYESSSPVSYDRYFGTIEKTGPGALQVYTAAEGAVKAESFVISSGRVDYQGYFDSYLGSGIDVKDGATFSPGLSDSGTIGEAILKSPIILESGSTILFEFGSYSGSDSNHDVLTIDKNARNDSVQFKPQTDSFIELNFLAGAAEQWAEKGAKYLLVADERIGPNPGASQIIDGDYTYLLANYLNMFELQGVAGEGIYLVGLGKPLPEPSTWALLILGAAGLLYWRKRK